MRSIQTPLIKVAATGNDFILVDLIQNHSLWSQEAASQTKRSEWVKRWCDRHNGIGADGVAFLEAHADFDFAWDFYNSDGGSAEMCGNAARAVSFYMHLSTNKSKFNFLTRAGRIQSWVKSANEIDVTMPAISTSDWNQWTSNSVHQTSFDFITAGVPHAVVRVPDVNDRERLQALALEIKREPRFQAHGTNVTFVRALSNSSIESVTFERGVEDFTLSCGTGAVAASHALLRGEENKMTEVKVPGGQLFVLFKDGYPHLIGPATLIAEIHWYL